ncbi:hypothetical protein BYT27DRAFT_7187149 [Phlegmacium glaucopus]|nr:hypothetical protein BYT27DRAFT_7187149 [Phlegmacium glaucopus]
MFRTASRLSKRTLLSASVAGTAVGLHQTSDKLSIYPSPTPDILLVESPSELENRIAITRRKALQTYSEAHAHIQGWVTNWIGIEHAVEHRIKSIISPNESLTPGLLYVGIATLTGSIIARNRMLATRFLLPPLFLVASANHFLPETTGNLSSYFGSLEETYFPSLSEKHDVAKAHTQMTWEKVKDATANSREQLNRGAMAVVEKVQEVTGLKLRETLGWTSEKVEEQKQEIVKIVDDVKATMDEKLEVAANRVEKKIEEVKRHV